MSVGKNESAIFICMIEKLKTEERKDKLRWMIIVKEMKARRHERMRQPKVRQEYQERLRREYKSARVRETRDSGKISDE